MSKGIRRIRRGGRKVIGKFPSIKMRKAVWWESQLERDCIYHLESDADVVFYKEQPMKIPYVLDGEIHHYTPDFLVERKGGGTQIIEVKPDEEADLEENQRMYRAVSEVLRVNGKEFVVAKESMIRTPALKNMKLLFKYSHVPVSTGHLIECEKFFFENDHPTLGMLTEWFGARGIGKEIVYALIFWGVIWANISSPLTDETIVSRRKPDSKGGFENDS